MFPLFFYYSLLLYAYYYRMPGKTRKIRKMKGRKGGNDATQFARKHGMWSFASTKQAALEIKNIYANYSAAQLDFGRHKQEINAIFGRKFGPSPFTPEQRIIKELEKFMVPGGPDVSPKNLYRAIREIRERK